MIKSTSRIASMDVIKSRSGFLMSHLMVMAVSVSLTTLALKPKQDFSLTHFMASATALFSSLGTTTTPPPQTPVAESVEKDTPPPAEWEEVSSLATYISKKYRVSKYAALEIVKKTFEMGDRYKVDPKLFLALMGVESRFNPIAESWVGAIGLSQVLPRAHPDKVDSADRQFGLLDTTRNIGVGMAVLAEYLKKHRNNETNALLQYNGSLNDPQEEYANKVKKERERMVDSVRLAGVAS